MCADGRSIAPLQVPGSPVHGSHGPWAGGFFSGDDRRGGADKATVKLLHVHTPVLGVHENRLTALVASGLF